MSDGTVGEHWLETALSRIRAGEPERGVMRDYGYVCEDCQPTAREPEGCDADKLEMCPCEELEMLKAEAQSLREEVRGL